jgi:hypothetical protein
MTYEEHERERLRKWLELAMKKLPLRRLEVLAEHACWYMAQECGKGHYEAMFREQYEVRLDVVGGKAMTKAQR